MTKWGYDILDIGHFGPSQLEQMFKSFWLLDSVYTYAEGRKLQTNLEAQLRRIIMAFVFEKSPIDVLTPIKIISDSDTKVF